MVRHLVSSDSASGLLKQLRIRHEAIHWSRDELTVGPCDLDPARHLELRREWHREWPYARLLSLADLRAALASEGPVTVWATREWIDLVWLWWVLEAVARLGVEPDQVLLVRPRPVDRFDGVGGVDVEQGREALATARPLTAGELAEGARLWRLFTAPTPVGLDEARRAGSAVFPELATSGGHHRAWFPRLADGRLRLAPLDELLLGQLDERWRTTGEILGELGERGRVLVGPFGAFVAIRRLRAWADHGVVPRDRRSDDNPFTQDAFRVTDRARALLDEGLDSVADAPPMPIGGAKAYDRAAPWTW